MGAGRIDFKGGGGSWGGGGGGLVEKTKSSKRWSLEMTNITCCYDDIYDVAKTSTIIS